MEDKIAKLIDLLERLLRSRAIGRGDLDEQLLEVMERFERDLPLTTSQVARLLDVSERTVRRIVRPSARSKPGGTVWYSKAEVDAVWRVRAGGNERSDSGSRRGRARSSRSSTAVSAGGSSTSSPQANPECDSLSVSAVEKRLRDGAANKLNES
jgi:hypothetical protein